MMSYLPSAQQRPDGAEDTAGQYNINGADIQKIDSYE